MGKQIKPIFTFIILMMTIGYLSAQSHKSFKDLALQTNEFLERYSKLSGFGDDYISIKDSGLPKKHIRNIQKEIGSSDGYAKDSITESNLIIEFQWLILNNIEKLIQHDKFNENNIQELISTQSDLSIVVSDDKKLYNFSLAEKTGGTYRSRISIMHYTDIDFTDTTYKQEIDSTINPFAIFEGDGFNEIHTIQTDKKETKYVLSSSVRSCSYCFATNVMLVRFENGRFIIDFDYGVNSRDWDGGVYYNPKTKTISADYLTDDLTTDCYCANFANSLESQDDFYKDETDKQKKCHCTFEFNGDNFELIKASLEKIKE